MKLIFKHLARSIQKKPLQPIILILTLTLSIATAIFAFTLDDMITDDLEAAQTAKYGNASLMISVGNSSDSRFLFVDDVIDVLGESAKAVGCYELPLVLDGKEDTTVAMATEFDRISDVFSIEFLTYGHVTESSVCDVAFISSDFAKKQGLSVGDTLTVETMGYTKNYHIEGISKDPFLATYDVMVDISGVVRAFADQSLLFAAIGDDFKPCGKIYVNIDAEDEGITEDSAYNTVIETDDGEEMTEEKAVSMLKADARFAEKRFDNLLNIEKKHSINLVLDVIVKSSVALAALLSAVVAFCCLYILANERSDENLILSYCGGSPKLLGGIQFAEVIFYWLVSIPMGVLAAIPITKTIAVFVNLRYTEVSIYPLTVIKSALIILAVCLITTTAFVVINKRLKRSGTTKENVNPRWIWGLCGAVVGLFVLLYTVPAAFRLKVYIFTMIAIIALVFLITPVILRRLSSAIDKKMRYGQKRSTIAFRYALKNICSLKLIHNIARLCALIVAIILTIGFVFQCADGLIQSWQQIFDADYVVYNATDRCYEKTRTCESANAVYRSYLNQSDVGVVISADDPSAYSDSFSMENQPKDNQAVISVGIAHKLDIKEGDTFSLELDGVKYDFVVLEIERIGANYIVINCDDLGIPYNMLLVEGKAEVSSAELLGELSKTTSTELAPIISIDALMEQRIDSMESYVNAGKILLLVFLIFSLIGMTNIFYESLRARREEFGFYRIAGMSRKELRLMKILELSVTVLVGVFIGIIAFIISAFAVNRGMSGLGAEIFLGIR